MFSSSLFWHFFSKFINHLLKHPDITSHTRAVNVTVLQADKDTRTVKPGFYAVPPQNIFEISPGLQLAM